MKWKKAQQNRGLSIIYFIASSHFMTGEDANTVPSQDVPQPNGAIGWASGHVVGVWVEAGAGDISQMARKYPQRLVVVCGPQTARDNQDRCIWKCVLKGDRRYRGVQFLPSHPVVSAGDKIISVRRELRVPHRVVVTLVANKASKCL